MTTALQKALTHCDIVIVVMFTFTLSLATFLSLRAVVALARSALHRKFFELQRALVFFFIFVFFIVSGIIRRGYRTSKVVDLVPHLLKSMNDVRLVRVLQPSLL